MPIERYTKCFPFDPHNRNLYEYSPSLAAGIVFVVLFFFTTTAHFVQSIWTRRWWMLVFAIGALTELMGWAGRTWNAECPNNLNGFLMQIVTLILGKFTY
jgi:hypothetical protein